MTTQKIVHRGSRGSVGTSMAGSVSRTSCGPRNATRGSDARPCGSTRSRSYSVAADRSAALARRVDWPLLAFWATYLFLVAWFWYAIAEWAAS